MAETASTAANDRAPYAVCAFLMGVAVFLSISPIESYLPEYLRTHVGLSLEQINGDIWPIYNYAFVIGIVPLSVISEYLSGYTVVIALSIVLRLLSSLIIRFGAPGSLMTQQAAMVALGVSAACKGPFIAFVYTLLPSRHYQMVTGWMRAGNLAAHVAGGLLGYLFKSTLDAPWSTFFNVQQSSICVSFLFLVLAIISSKFVIKKAGSADVVSTAPIVKSVAQLRKLIGELYPTSTIALWSIWACCAFALFDLIAGYHSTLYLTIDRSANKNGIVLAVSRVSSALTTLAVSHTSFSVDRFGLPIVSVGSLTIACLTLASGFATNIYVSYCCLIVICSMFECLFCLARSYIAIETPRSLRGIAIFFNTVAALIIEAGLQMACGPWMFALSIRVKFLVFGVLFAALSVGIAIGHWSRSSSTPEKSTTVGDVEIA
ncbi:Major facilitator superfamily (MFS) profile domain-containing protein [Plasmodiophora brassicae]